MNQKFSFLSPRDCEQMMAHVDQCLGILRFQTLRFTDADLRAEAALKTLRTELAEHWAEEAKAKKERLDAV